MDKTKLIYTPPIQLVFIDPNTGEPCDGELLFYVNGTNTPKNAYIATNDPSNPFQAVTKLKLNGAGSPDATLFFYPYEEDDALTSQSYRVVATNKNDVAVVTKDNFPPTTSGGDKPTENENIDNLFPSYGFDSQLFKNFYTAKDNNKNSLPNGKNPISQGWIWERQGTDNRLAQYDFEPILNSTIDGNPKNALTLSVTNATVNDTKSRLYARIGDYQSFQGKRLLLGIHAVDLEGSEKTLNVHYFRQKQGVDTGEIGSGTIAVNSTIEEQSTTSFTIQALSDQGYLNSDGLFVAIDLPLSNFKLQLTATILQETDANTLIITEQNTGKNKASSVYALEDITEKEDFSENYAALPMMLTGNGISVNKIASRIEILPKGQTFDGYYEIGSQSIELISDEKKNDTKTNRLIKALRHSGIIQSPYTFICSSPADDELTISTGLAINQLEDWKITASNTIAFKTGSDGKNNAYSMAVKAIIELNDADKNRTGINFKWKDNGVVSSAVLDRVVKAGSPLAYMFDVHAPQQGRVPILANYCCVLVSNQSTTTGNAQLKNNNRFDSYNQGTASTPANYTLLLTADLYDVNQNGIAYNTTLDTSLPFKYSQKSYANRIFKTVEANYFANSDDSDGKYPLNYLGWNDPSHPITNGKTSSKSIHRYVLGFNYDGDGGNFVPQPTTGGIRRLVNIQNGQSLETVAKNIVNTINDATTQSFKYSARPNTGNKFNIDNGKTKFSFVYVVGNDQKPIISDGSKVFYIHINESDDIKTAKNAAITVIENSVIGIPSQQELNLPNLEGYGYYMKA